MLANSRGALVSIQARDFERAVTFYTEVLGLPLSFRHGNLWAEVRAPGLTVGIETAGDGTVVGGGTTSVVFEVSDIARAVEGLRARGVSFLGPVQETFYGKTASFCDCEGNPILLVELFGADEEPRRAREAAAKPARKATRPAKRKATAKASAKAKARAKAAKKPAGRGRLGSKAKRGKGRR